MKTIGKSLLFLWPGSTGALRCGLADQLVIALLYGLALNAIVVLNFAWTDFLPSSARTVSAVGLVAFQLFLSATASGRMKKYERMRNADESGELMLEAQTHYLRGNWFETECCLKAALRQNRYDVEALLMLATLYRHIRRFDDARRALNELEKIDCSVFWSEEIAFEKEAVKADEAEAIEEAEAERRERVAQKLAERKAARNETCSSEELASNVDKQPDVSLDVGVEGSDNEGGRSILHTGIGVSQEHVSEEETRAKTRKAA